MLLLHGVVPAGRELDEQGELADGEYELIEDGDLAVLAREVVSEDDLTEDDAVKYLDALVELVRDGPVLPLRFGTVAPDVDAVRSEVLAPAAEQFARALDATASLVELRLTFTLTDEAVQRLFREDPELRAAVGRGGPGSEMSERIEVGQLVAQRLTEQRSQLVAAWVAMLGELTEDSKSISSSEEGWEQVALLVRRERLDELDEAVRTLTNEVDGLAEIEYVGPLPLYSFDAIGLADASSTTQAQQSRWGW
ncbi:Gas vesicle synthesis protein GvpL/GvpF [Actinopolymorpha cephalotaxi]|uniref:Gas vesicle synthesis protein GvpL/GvpF n=1 Tax=Actinopolymorpha cephalotaxi TaxID=504797 RepID=A0A1I2PP05_9ACTN|nr:GvpL/GvpF family gas vesicle protein [Actinopolymorpha cephalotaxi]NYH83617.1 hypothetical protein [Actinopolymorpha cephalotaxi]SFG15161.1 Gas vesicle synthesis protein GvpL/GvpF [Actinopolymorpha cephalotaxi]